MVESVVGVPFAVSPGVTVIVDDTSDVLAVDTLTRVIALLITP